jgi:CelD/BcsL family acetyltransferase involved in cellulose biosynthesis
MSRIDILRPDQLTRVDELQWAKFLDQRPDLRGPYFDIRYVRAIGAAVPNAGVARIFDNERVVAYFPYQIRSGVLQPMGAPLSDYHGLVSASDATVDFDELLKATGAKRLEFQGWVGPQSPRANGVPLKRRIADTSVGFDAWWQVQNAVHHKFFKNIGRCRRNVEKDFGGFAFTWERVTPQLADWVLNIKRQQYRKCGMHDIFNCGWTRTLLDHLAVNAEEGYGLYAGVFRHEGRVVAAEICLAGKDEVHLWFPAYDPAFYRYSIGILLAVAIIEHGANAGIKRFDFGTGGEDYKAPLTVEGGTCHDGDLDLKVPRATVALDRLSQALPAAKSRIAAARLSLKRRIKLIRATETSRKGWRQAVLAMARRAAMRGVEMRPLSFVVKASLFFLPFLRPES